LTFDRAQLWDKASTIISSSWTKWTAAGGVVCLAAYAVSRARAPAVKIDEQLSQAGENTAEVMTVFKTLSPIRGHWFYAKRWEALKAHLEAHPTVMGPFYEAVLEHQINDPTIAAPQSAISRPVQRISDKRFIIFLSPFSALMIFLPKTTKHWWRCMRQGIS
jgi:hypothetical protein